MSHRRLERATDLYALRDAARAVLPRMVFDAIEGGAGREATVARNRAALDRVLLVPRALQDVSHRDASVSLFGRPSALPLAIGPMGLASAFWPKAEIAMARAAAHHNIPFVMSSGSSASPEELAEASDGRLWFQLYMPPQRDAVRDWVGRISAAGFELIEVTVDAHAPGLRHRDMRNGFSLPLRWTPAKALQIAGRPGWALRIARSGVPRPALPYPPGASTRQRFRTRGEALQTRFDPALTWEGLRWLRDLWKGPLVLKGVTDPDCVPTALEIGLDGIIVSNHGGRQLDGSIGAADVLPAFAERAAGRIPLLMDGGIMGGTDVLKALALGASAVQVGRAVLYGVAVAGEEGARHALGLLRREIDNAMALMGVTAATDMGPERIRHARDL